MKKKIFHLLVFFILTGQGYSQTWQWGIHDGSTQEETTLSLCTDAHGNIYTLGRFGYGPNIISIGVFAGDTLIISGSTDLFIASYDTYGNSNWAKRAGSQTVQDFEYCWIYNNKVDSSLYLFGYFYSDFSIDTFNLNGNASTEELYLGRLNYAGNSLWLKKAISLPDGGGISVMSNDHSGRIYILGTSFAGATLDTINIPAGVFVSRVNSDGDFLWAKKIVDLFGTFSWNIKAINTGFIASGIYYDSLIIDSIQIVGRGKHDLFIALFDSLGSVQWVRSYGGPQSEFKSIMDIDDQGNIYITAFFSDSIYFDSTLLTHGGKDVFLAKFDPQGNFLWAKQLFANGDAESNDIDVDDQGNVYITGYFNLQATFGGNTVTATSYPSMFLARYNSTGDFLGVRYFGSARGTNVVSDGSSVIVSGTFTNSVNIDNTTLTSNGLTDMFVAKHDAFTGVGELNVQRKQSLFIYANPSTGKCTIKVPEEFLNENNLVLSIFDQNGKAIREYAMEMNDGKIRLNLEAEAKGTYVVKLSNGLKQYTGRIVFE